jgi:hypothetical protein
MQTIYLLFVNGKYFRSYVNEDLANLNGVKTGLLYHIEESILDEQDEFELLLEDDKLIIYSNTDNNIEFNYEIDTDSHEFGGGYPDEDGLGYLKSLTNISLGGKSIDEMSLSKEFINQFEKEVESINYNLTYNV